MIGRPHSAVADAGKQASHKGWRNVGQVLVKTLQAIADQHTERLTGHQYKAELQVVFGSLARAHLFHWRKRIAKQRPIGIGALVFRTIHELRVISFQTVFSYFAA